MIFFSFSDKTIGSLCLFWGKTDANHFCFVKNLKMLYELSVRFKSFLLLEELRILYQLLIRCK